MCAGSVLPYALPVQLFFLLSVPEGTVAGDFHTFLCIANPGQLSPIFDHIFSSLKGLSHEMEGNKKVISMERSL